jgi:glycerol-3-phosphate dehydrogenase
VKRSLDALAEGEHDLLIIGGGIHGAAAAWDAAQRGLRVALVEAGDFGSGASWNSLKTIHGGLRHLQRLDLAGLRESARERRALLRVAPDLVRPLQFVVPAHGHGARGRQALAAGLVLCDILTWDRNRGVDPARRIPRGRTLSRAGLEALVPEIGLEGVSGAALWTDAQVESTERLLLAFLHAASGAGARLANHVAAVMLLREGGAVRGALLRDAATGRELRARARAVLLAAGAALPALLDAASIPSPRVPLLRALNLVLGRRPAARVAVGSRHRGRYLFLAPWGACTLVGTEYAPADAEPIRVERFLAEAQEAFPWAGLRHEDVVLAHRGLVPGDARGLWTRGRVVDHGEHGAAGLFSIVAVKYTTARALAERAIDRIQERLGHAVTPCRTAETPLPAATTGPLDDRARHAVREEMALHLSDAVLRRLDLGTSGPPGEAEVAHVVATMSSELGWDEERTRAERASLDRFYAESLHPTT